MNIYQRICPVCGRPFATTQWNKKYCSNECYWSWTASRQREYYKQNKFYLNTCKICGKKFVSTNYKRCYCSPFCRKKRLIKSNKTKKSVLGQVISINQVEKFIDFYGLGKDLRGDE